MEDQLPDLQFKFDDCLGKISEDTFTALTQYQYNDLIEFNAEIIELDQPIDVAILVHENPRFIFRYLDQKLWIEINKCDPAMIIKGKTIKFFGKISKQKPIMTMT